MPGRVPKRPRELFEHTQLNEVKKNQLLTQSLHTNSMDEALWLPTEKAVRVALRTQQMIAYESGAADSIDPLAGSYLIEHLTDEIERCADEYIQRIDAMGGALAAIEQGFIQARSRTRHMPSNRLWKRARRLW